MNTMNEIVTLASDLIRFRTIEGSTAEFTQCMNYIRNYLDDTAGIYIYDFEFNGVPSMVIANRPSIMDFDILMNGHIDVVPAPDSDFIPRQKAGKLYGRGASDMKTAVAAMLVAMKHTAPATNASIALMIVSDEEVGGFNGTAQLVDAGYRGKVIIIPDDMGNLEMTTKEKGILQLDLTFRGKAAHSCEPWKGESAVDNFVAFATEIRAKFPQPTTEAWLTTCNIGLVEGGVARNQLAEQAKASLDIRYIETDVPEKIIESISQLAVKHNAAIKKTLHGVAVNTPLHHPLVEQFAMTATQVLGRPVGNAVDHGASDARFFAEVNCPVILFKPPSEGMHGANEAVDLAGVAQFYEIITNYCKTI